MSLFRTAITGADNESTDIGRVLWATLVLAMIAFEGWRVVHGGVFDALSFSAAAAAILGGGAGALHLKKSTEPTP